MLKKIFSVFFVTAFFIFLSICAEAAGPPGPPGGGPPCWPPPCTVPLDGGISFLIAAGAGLAGKKLYDLRKKSS